MVKYHFLSIMLCFFLIVPALFAEKRGEDFFFAPRGEVTGYGTNGYAYGGGLMIGAGTGGALGLSLLYAVDDNNFIFMEMLFFLRGYIFGANAFSGPFLQLSAGPVIYADTNPEITSYGNISAGLTTGWRFLLGRHFFLEPAVRIGYPYLAGAGLALGVRR